MNQHLYRVLNGHTLGYLLPANQKDFQILAAKPQLGATHTWLDGSCPIVEADKLQAATFKDFENFRVSPKGHIDEVGHTEDILADSVFSKVHEIMRGSSAERYVWQTAFRQAALEAGVQDKSDLMGCVVSRCMSQLIYTVTVS